MNDPDRTSLATDFVVHLNCLSDSSFFKNTSSQFTNLMNPHILLPYHTRYEVGVSNIYFEPKIYPILANEEESGIQLIIYKLKQHGNETQNEKIANSSREEVVVERSSEVGSVAEVEEGGEHMEVSEVESRLEKESGLNISKQIDYTVLDVVNSETVYPNINLKNDIKSVINEYNRVFKHDVLKFNEVRSKLEFDGEQLSIYANSCLKHNPDFKTWYEGDMAWFNNDPNRLIAIALKFGRRVGNYLGFIPNTPIFIYSIGHPTNIFTSWESLNEHKITKNQYSTIENVDTKLISNVLVYCDVIKTSRVGSQNTNLLEIIPVNSFSKKNSLTVYKEVSWYDIQSISIRLTDEYGRNISFIDNTYVAIDLHFKPKS